MTLMIHHDAMNDLRLVEPGPTAQAGPWGAHLAGEVAEL
jgi:hypothetical protein